MTVNYLKERYGYLQPYWDWLHHDIRLSLPNAFQEAGNAEGGLAFQRMEMAIRFYLESGRAFAAGSEFMDEKEMVDVWLYYLWPHNHQHERFSSILTETLESAAGIGPATSDVLAATIFLYLLYEHKSPNDVIIDNPEYLLEIQERTNVPKKKRINRGHLKALREWWIQQEKWVP